MPPARSTKRAESGRWLPTTHSRRLGRRSPGTRPQPREDPAARTPTPLRVLTRSGGARRAGMLGRLPGGSGFCGPARSAPPFIPGAAGGPRPAGHLHTSRQPPRVPPGWNPGPREQTRGVVRRATGRQRAASQLGPEVSSAPRPTAPPSPCGVEPGKTRGRPHPGALPRFLGSHLRAAVPEDRVRDRGCRVESDATGSPTLWNAPAEGNEALPVGVGAGRSGNSPARPHAVAAAAGLRGIGDGCGSQPGAILAGGQPRDPLLWPAGDARAPVTHGFPGAAQGTASPSRVGRIPHLSP